MIAPLGKAVVKTDIAIAVPAGCYGRVGEFHSLTKIPTTTMLVDNVIHTFI